MTDKQIIIDDVDVSGCENYIGANTKTHNCTLYDGYLRPCKGTNCYYKQLKAKEQECEDLKSALKKKTDEYNKLTVNYDAYVSMANKQLDQLKAENEELKKRISGYKCPMEKNADYCGYLEESGLRYVENEFLKQTLTEIKEIVQFGFRPYKVCGEHNNCCDVLNEIWNKISGCEEEDGN